MKKFAIGVGVIFLSFVMVGSGYAGYICSGTIFSDVNSTTEPAFCGFIEYFYALGITGGCGTSPLRYCPDNYVTRGQMAVFISTAIDKEIMRPTPMQIALLRWYEANQSGNTFPVGTNPNGIAFDGTNIWVANNASDNVTKLRASDGANLGTFPAGTQPTEVVFDGANIWVTNWGSNSVSKL